MKTLMAIVALTFTILFVACDTNEVQTQTLEIKTKNNESSITASLVDGEWQVNESDGIYFLIQKFELNENIKTQKFNFYFNDKTRKGYMTMVCKDSEGKNHSVGVDLNQNQLQRGRETLADTSHSCTGNPCTSCEFTYGGDSINGCKCNDTNPRQCNHTISE